MAGRWGGIAPAASRMVYPFTANSGLDESETGLTNARRLMILRLSLFPMPSLSSFEPQNRFHYGIQANSAWLTLFLAFAVGLRWRCRWLLVPLE
jgi:hypothetical protein